MVTEALGKTHVLNDRLWEKLTVYFSEEDFDLVSKACSFAEDHFAHLNHPIGKPYLEYIYEVTELLCEFRVNPVAIAAAIACPPPSLLKKVIDPLRKQFKNEITSIELVESILQLGRLEWSIWPIVQDPNDHEQGRERQDILHKMYALAIDEVSSEDAELPSPAILHFQKKEKQIENIIRMFLATTTDMNALIIKLIDRLYLIKLLKDLPSEKQEALNHIQLAKITLAIYAQLADRIGIWQLKSNLEDMSFRLIDPLRYKEIARQLAAKKEQREAHINNIIPLLREKLEEYGIEAAITGRAKHIYSIYNKMVAKNLSFEEVKDLLGFRIIVNSKQDCYDVLEIILDNWPAETDVYNGESYRDWIATPKENQYQSLHTTVKIGDKIVEIQIRTKEMHEIAEYGVASAHWRYKESKTYRKGKTPRVLKTKEQIWDQELAQLRKSVIEEKKQASANRSKSKILKDRIYVITPKGHIIDLPTGATPLDFAYRIHTDLGHRYLGAKVGGRFVSIDYELRNGNITEIITSRARKGPNPEWLSKSRLDNELKSADLAEFLIASIENGRIPQWLYRKEEASRNRDKETKETKNEEDIEGKDESNSKKQKSVDINDEINNYMYYVFARTRQARNKIHQWLNKHQEE
ncbi:MAG TPA: TGS domain-containing protein [Ktedonobacteraceae bacterium]|nr:TGS domain-containing protein [Ktedonobacteraceae bacterium]